MYLFDVVDRHEVEHRVVADLVVALDARTEDDGRGQGQAIARQSAHVRGEPRLRVLHVAIPAGVCGGAYRAQLEQHSAAT